MAISAAGVIASCVVAGADEFTESRAASASRHAAHVSPPTARARRGLQRHSHPRQAAHRDLTTADQHRRAGVYAADGRGRFSPAVAGIRPRVYVPNTLDGTVDEIDPRTYRVIRRITVGGEPHHITPSWDLRHLYVDNAGAGLLQVIDPRTGRLGRAIRVSTPYNLYFTPDGTKAIVVAEAAHLLEFRDPHTWRILGLVPIPWPGVDHMDFSATGRFLLVSCEYSGIVVRVDTRRMKVTGTLDVGGRPVDVKVSPNGRVFYVANQGLGGVSVVDPRSMRQIAFIPTGTGAHGFAVGRDGTSLYLSNRIAGTVSVIDFATRRVVRTWHVGGSPDMLQVSPDGTQLWASNRFGDTVSIISTTTGRVIRSIIVGRGPHGLSFFPEPGAHSIGHNGVYR
ncbi:MAG: YncE family protein [Actinomycetota bacterium]